MGVCQEELLTNAVFDAKMLVRQIWVYRGGFAPSTPTKGPFGNILAFARGEFAFGKYREVLWNPQKL
jgi:hypothetical protein